MAKNKRIAVVSGLDPVPTGLKRPLSGAPLSPLNCWSSWRIANECLRSLVPEPPNKPEVLSGRQAPVYFVLCAHWIPHLCPYRRIQACQMMRSVPVLARTSMALETSASAWHGFKAYSGGGFSPCMAKEQAPCGLQTRRNIQVYRVAPTGGSLLGTTPQLSHQHIKSWLERRPVPSCLPEANPRTRRATLLNFPYAHHLWVSTLCDVRPNSR